MTLKTTFLPTLLSAYLLLQSMGDLFEPIRWVETLWLRSISTAPPCKWAPTDTGG